MKKISHIGSVVKCYEGEREYVDGLNASNLRIGETEKK